MQSGLTLDWLQQQLARLLQFDDNEELAKYILSIENDQDREEYLREMLDHSMSKEFFEELRLRTRKDEQKQEPLAYRKPDFSGARQKTTGKENNSSPKEQESSIKKKSKYVALYSSEGQAKDVVMLKGRHMCECLATKHQLVNNCTECGRIVCSQEGSGPCLFCGSLVCTKDELDVLNRNSKKSDQLRKKLMAVGGGDPRNENKVDMNESLAKAEKHKNTLLEYDRTSEARTKVIDDESDYFSMDSNQWLTPQQRKALQKRSDEINEKKHESRLNRKFTFDFAGRRVLESDSDLRNYDPTNDKVVQDVYKTGKSLIQSFSAQDKTTLGQCKQDHGGIANVDVPRPMLVDSVLEKRPKGSRSVDDSNRGMRIQDAQLQEMSDEGFCLSMHQPWASYLVAGIKLHEGRTWYSAHRGRLWIHAASKDPTKEEITEVQQFYCKYYGVDRKIFPPLLPTSCLLGCVDVVDCLGQEEYQEQYPKGESESPFVFICTNPQELLVKFPMSGKHKIYKLDPKIHQAAKKAAKKTGAGV